MSKTVFDFDVRISEFWQENYGRWPNQLTSGVAFYKGLRITRTEVEEFASAFGEHLEESLNK